MTGIIDAVFYKGLALYGLFKICHSLTVIQFHFRINVYWHMLQTIIDRTVDVIFCSGVVVDLYWRLYIGGSH